MGGDHEVACNLLASTHGTICSASCAQCFIHVAVQTNVDEFADGHESTRSVVAAIWHTSHQQKWKQRAKLALRAALLRVLSVSALHRRGGSVATPLAYDGMKLHLHRLDYD
eukprot:6183008-Pleurochrysis_carterae.AAC.3